MTARSDLVHMISFVESDGHVALWQLSGLSTYNGVKLSFERILSSTQDDWFLGYYQDTRGFRPLGVWSQLLLSVHPIS